MNNPFHSKPKNKPRIGSLVPTILMFFFLVITILILLVIQKFGFFSGSAVASPIPSFTITPTTPVTATPTATSTTVILDTPTPTSSPTTEEGIPFSIGYSVNGLPLEMVRFGNGPSQRLIVAGIHGGYEWNTVTLAEELIAYINSDPSIIPENVTLYILRNLNPDGYATGFDANGRANANGVDLNRNWDANWQPDWDRAVCFNQVYVTGGSGPESEPEVKALADFIRTHPLDALLSYHSASLGIFPGGSPPGPLSSQLAYALSQVSPYAYPPKEAGCVYTGQLIDWAVLQGIPAVDVELSSHKYTDLEINKEILRILLAWRKD